MRLLFLVYRFSSLLSFTSIRKDSFNFFLNTDIDIQFFLRKCFQQVYLFHSIHQLRTGTGSFVEKFNL